MEGDASTSEIARLAVTQWWLGATNPKKVIHAASCHYGRMRYRLLDGMTADEVYLHLNATHSVSWHAVHKVCCPDLAELLASSHEVLGGVCVAHGEAWPCTAGAAMTCTSEEADHG